MADAGSASPRQAALRVRRPTAVDLRLASGLVLFAFALTHLLNHALGLVSIDTMLAVQEARMIVTRSLPGTVILILSAVVHLALGLARFTQSHIRRMGWQNAIQLGFGLMIPIMLIRHVLGTHGVNAMFGVDDDYRYALWVMWPGQAINLALLIGLVWIHACIGLHHWLGGRAWYRRTLRLWQGLALLIPVLGYAGFVSAARLEQATGTFRNPLSLSQYARYVDLVTTSNWIYLCLLAAAAAVWGLFLVADRLGSRITVTYVDGPAAHAPRGLSILAISRVNRIPHAAVCGGRARCSTCRVRVMKGQDNLPPPSDLEQRVLRRLGAPANVRLACQVYPKGNITISTLLPAKIMPDTDMGIDRYLWGVERDVTVMFCDLREFTHLTEGRLPYDIVFVLNQFLGRMAETIEDTGGFVDKFMGDSVMAIFGMEVSPRVAALQAMAAARAMDGVLDGLNQSLREALPAPLAMGIGMHSGPAILGRIGTMRQAGGDTSALTALGETVNLASRLEGKSKELGVQLVVSTETADLAGLGPCAGCVPQMVDVRGLSHPIKVYAVRRATDLPASVAAAS